MDSCRCKELSPARSNQRLTPRRLAECWNACAGAARLAAEQQVQQLREALKFYAGNFPNDDLANWQERICADEGDKAKQALADTDQQKASRNS